VIARRARLAALEPPASAGPDLQAAVRQAVDEAFVSGFREVMGLAAALALLSSLSAFVMIGKGGKPH
jgi:threonine/homoserine/homoserine lactone efflux protein